MGGMNPSEAEMASISSALGDGFTKEAFVDLMSKRGRKGPTDELEVAFQAFDVDGSGLIDAEELKGLMEKLQIPVSEEDVAAMIDIADEKGRGGIDYRQFKQWLIG